MWRPFSRCPPFLKVGAGFRPQNVFGRAGASPHVQTNAMLAPSKDGRFPVPVVPPLLLETVSFRQAGPQTPNVADFSSCRHFPGPAAERRTNGLTGRDRGLRDRCDGCDRKSLTHFSRHSCHCCHRHRIRCIAGERPLFGYQKRGCRVYPVRRCTS